ncbi:MAG: SAM-dependent chlorinase/fluorinase [Chloroflexota bacterium]
MAGPLITLLTDFGTADAYVGVMKGVILALCPEARLVDLTHQVPPQDVCAGAHLLAEAVPHFPPGTIHLAVVDPGVGTERRPLLVTGPTASFVCPDNGVLSLVLANAGAQISDGEATLPPSWSAHHLTNPAYWRHPVSATFHGRDIFAPVAAYLSLGVGPDTLGQRIEPVTAFAPPVPVQEGDALVGEVVRVDRFGNLLTNIPADSLPRGCDVRVSNRRIGSVLHTYADGTPGTPMALVGSDGCLEIAVPQGSAADTLGAGVGGRVRVSPPESRPLHRT